MKIKLLKYTIMLMFGIMHGAKMGAKMGAKIEIIQQGNVVKGSLLDKSYDFSVLWNGQPVDEKNNPLSITEVLEKYYVTEVRVQELVVEINFITIIKGENGFIICIFLKHKGPCPTSQFPFPMSGDGEQNANLYLESTDIQLDYFASYLWILLPLTVRPGQYDYVNLETITELCEELMSYLARSGWLVSETLYKINTYKLSPIDFIAKYPHDLTEIEINVIEKSSIANEVKSFYEFMILTTTAFNINVHNLRAHSLLNSTIKSHTQRLLEIYFDHIIEKRNNKTISNEETRIIAAFCEKYNIDDNGGGLTRMKNKILDIFYGIEGRAMKVAIECKETIDILRLIKDYAWLDAEIYRKTYKISDFSSGLPGAVAELRALTDVYR